MKEYTFISDNGHGWLRVPYKDVAKAGVLSKISSCSYVSCQGRYIYLEEDCDAGAFLEAAGLDSEETCKKMGVNFKHKNVDGQSRIRNLEQFDSKAR